MEVSALRSEQDVAELRLYAEVVAGLRKVHVERVDVLGAHVTQKHSRTIGRIVVAKHEPRKTTKLSAAET